jgi:poly(A) polymerase
MTSSVETILDRLPQPQRQVTRKLAEAFAANGEQLFLVGGVVRDLILGAPASADLDFATSAQSNDTQTLLNRAGSNSVYLVGERFGTIGAIFTSPPDVIQVEITSFRREAYLDATRFPTVAFDATLDDDLDRRDFTMNAIAVEAATGEVIDPWGGEADIAHAVVRAVGNASERFNEDPLRLLRAARFVSQLGFRLDWQTEQAMQQQSESLTRISRERVLAELNRLLIGDYVDNALDVLRRTGTLRVALPELEPLLSEAAGDLRARFGREKDLWNHTLRVVRQSPPRLSVRWAALLHDAGKPFTRGIDPNGEVHFYGHEQAGASLATRVLTRLNAEKSLRVGVPTLVALHGRPAAYDESWTDSAVRRLALEAGSVWNDLLDLAAADVTSGRARKQIEAAQRVANLRNRFERLENEAELERMVSPLDGDQLMAIFDLPPGPWIKRVKEQLRELVIDGSLAPDDQNTAISIARTLITGELTNGPNRPTG